MYQRACESYVVAEQYGGSEYDLISVIPEALLYSLRVPALAPSSGE